MSESSPIIAVDLDDVLGQTNLAVAQWHNEHYGTTMGLPDFYYYHYWKNPLWGTPYESLVKVKAYYASSIMKPVPVPGALEGLQSLRDMGYTIDIVTARHTTEIEHTRTWLDHYYHGLYNSVTCTGQFTHDPESGNEVHVRVSKAEVCHRLGAKVIVDDSVENALACATADPPVDVLLFGDYEWNKRCSTVDEATDKMSFADRLAYEGGREWWKEETVELPRNVRRVKNWQEVVEWVKENVRI